MQSHHYTHPIVVEVCDAAGVGGHRRAENDPLLELVYELLDAHFDTVSLAKPLEHDEEWAAHLDYLRGLQRAGREAVARIAA